MKPNPKAIKALKRVMTLEQRKEFVRECKKYHRLSNNKLEKHWKNNRINIEHLVNNTMFCFYWGANDPGDKWGNIYNKLTGEEKALKLFIKPMENKLTGDNYPHTKTI